MGTENVKLGVCNATFDGVNLGLTKGGVEVEVTTETHEVMVDQFGNTPVNEYITARTLTIRVPMAETSVEMLTRVMPGTTLFATGGVKATGTMTVATNPTTNDTVTVNGEVFTFKTGSAPGAHDVLIGVSAALTAAAFQAKLAASISPLVTVAKYTVATTAVTATYIDAGVIGNSFTLASSSANVTVSAATLATGADATKKKAQVVDGTGINLLSLAKKLVLHPKALLSTDKSEDFVVPKAMTPGAISYAYKLDEERVFNVEFKGYPDSVTGLLFVLGDETAT